MDLAHISRVGELDYHENSQFYKDIKSYSKRVFWANVRFRIAEVLNKSERTCWTDLAMWATYGQYDAFKGAFSYADSCREESVWNGPCECLCGKFCYGKVVDHTKSKTAMQIVPVPSPWELKGKTYRFKDLVEVSIKKYGEEVQHG